VNVAQTMHRAEATLRTRLLGEALKPTRPLSETKCVGRVACCHACR
jgi:hypothetical protein